MLVAGTRHLQCAHLHVWHQKHAAQHARCDMPCTLDMQSCTRNMTHIAGVISASLSCRRFTQVLEDSSPCFDWLSLGFGLLWSDQQQFASAIAPVAYTVLCITCL